MLGIGPHSSKLFQSGLAASATEGRRYVFMPTKVDRCSAVAEMGDHLATIDIGRKLGGAVPFLVGVTWVPM